MGVLYILDEPSIGLHHRDNNRLISTLQHLRDLGNTVIVVEHDEATMEAADWIVDMGPKAGIHGGEVIAQGTFDQISDNSKSITGHYLSGKKSIYYSDSRRKGNGKALQLIGARGNNLKKVNLSLTLGKFS